MEKRIGILTTSDFLDKPFITKIVAAAERVCPAEYSFEVVDMDEDRAFAWDVAVNRASDSGSGNAGKALRTQHVLQAWKLRGSRVLNGAEPFGICMSKECQHALIESVELRYPKSVKITENGSPLILAQRARELKFPVLQKPNLGGYGRGMVRYTSIAELESKFTACNSPDGVDWLQEEHRGKGGWMYRAFVLGEKVTCCVKVRVNDRSAGDFNTCMCSVAAQNADLVAVMLSPSWTAQVLRIMRACRADLGSVEFLEDEHTGELFFFDVNLCSTFPDVKSVADAQNVWGETYDPWEDCAKFLCDQASATDRPDGGPPEHGIPVAS